MRTLNNPSPTDRKNSLISANYVETLPLYQGEDGETTDIDKAVKMSDGSPIRIGYSTTTIPHSCYNAKHVISFNPTNPEMRQTAFIARANIHEMAVSPNVYMDRIEAQTYCDNSISACAESIKSIKSKIDNPETN